MKRNQGAYVKTKIAFLAALVFALVAAPSTIRGQAAKPAQAPAAAAVPAQKDAGSPAATLDPAKEKAIRKMFEVMGTGKLMQQVMTTMMNNMRPMLVSSLPDGEYREKLVDLFFQKFQSKINVQQLIDLTVPVYGKYFSTEEIEGLTKFYQTPLGQKSLSVLPQTTSEIQAEAGKWGEKAGRDSMMEVLEEHPEMKKALEDAAASAK
jgi:hypothetical protein